MRDSDWELIEHDLVGNFTTKIWLLRRSGGRVEVAHFVKGIIELQEIKQGSDQNEIEPTLTINYDLWKYIKKSLVQDKVREKNEVESELQATKYHLQDLRKLLKL